MRPKPISTPAAGETDMFRNRLDNMIDMRHELVRLAGLIEWKRFDEAFGTLYAEKGRPGLPTRLMVGLHLLKHARGISDDQVCAQWIENAYFQFFCGETYFQTKLPLDRTSMSVWRGRIGADKLELLLSETLAAATRAKAVDKSQMERVTVDTTAQTKAVAHPTDSHLLLRAVEWLNKLAKKHGIGLRQSYMRLATRARREVSRLIHGRGHKQAMRYLRKMRTWAGRLVRDIERKIEGQPDLQHACELKLNRVKAFLAQKPDDKNKIYALHAPEVECIAKGKARTRYEFGVKSSIAVTNARADGGQFILGIRTAPGLPYDGHTLKGPDRPGRAANRGGGRPRLCRQRIPRSRAHGSRHPRHPKPRPSNADHQTGVAATQRNRTGHRSHEKRRSSRTQPARRSPRRRHQRHPCGRRTQHPATPRLVEGAFVVPVRPCHLEWLTTKALRRSRSIRYRLKNAFFADDELDQIRYLNMNDLKAHKRAPLRQP
jgi:IS5 family transposase